MPPLLCLLKVTLPEPDVGELEGQAFSLRSSLLRAGGWSQPKWFLDAALQRRPLEPLGRMLLPTDREWWGVDSIVCVYVCVRAGEGAD
eukprot:1652852-Amphidinium_carterae.1